MNLQYWDIKFFSRNFIFTFAPVLSVIFIFPALFLGFIYKCNFFKDKFNLFFLSVSVLMTVASTVHFLGSSNFEEITWNNKLSFIGLLNWIPLFLVFYTSDIS